ncbi:filamentous hemagglutinin N-terminal domain-containing protein [Nostoc sp. CENA67]|uniref:Filamentous hemagglutinin N-terminal domain-containing protein n=1 Tax=Amazonocrinis nigriterrae CENA67 TaxID=2794033 RepID=A0A8J7L8H7_9NOST|nr:filamentous hemagglutinin N-terminal domain-containing protein [Amazonocrinis nigriterrae]MBH8564484.1 filamentous hemagglutinin N-terminal domain-containing protein [Amazonocrinis nigriterrae CENA67]
MQGLRRSLFFITLPLVTLECLASLDTAKGQIIPDNSLGAEKSVVNSNANIDQIDGGARRGANLFHSFQEFNVGQQGKAYFTNPAGIENILSRVTGKNPSNIFGILGVSGNANLFFINPNGIVFGPDARLDMHGSFLASTANSLLFDGGLEFSASNPQAPSMLTVNIPIGLQFRKNPGKITNQSVADDLGLQVDPGKTLSIVGGDISLDGGRFTAAGGQVALGSLAGTGTVGLNSDASLSFPDSVTRGNVSLTNGAQLSTSTYAQGNAGSIKIKARSLTMNDQASLTTSTFATQDTTGQPSSGGTILLQVDDAIKLDNSDIQNNLESGGVGKGGEIKIKTGLLSLLNGSQIQTLVRGAYENQPAGKGNAGNINIQANDVILEGVSNTNLAPTKEIFPSSIRSEVQSNAQGNAGSIKIKARSLTMNDQASLTTSTFATQDTTGQPSRAGMISLQADDGIKLGNSSYIFNNVESGAVGQGGEVKIKTGSLLLLNGSQIQTIVRGAYENQLAGKGNAGNITIHANKDVIFDGFSNTDLAGRQDIFFSGITSDVESGVKGNAGNIEITTPKDIRLDNKASIRANTSGGKGNITLHPRDLILRRNSNITTNAEGAATGGNITINTDNLVALEDSDITANAEESYGGKVRITAKRIFKSQDSDITASSELGPEFSGEVKLNLANVDPSHGLVELPKNVVDPTEQIAQNPCQRGVGSKFTITGRGGLPPSPNEATSGDAVRVDLVEPAPGGSRGAEEQGSRGAGEKIESTVTKPIVPAQGWILNKKGEVILTAYDPTGTGSQRPVNSDICPVP